MKRPLFVYEVLTKLSYWRAALLVENRKPERRALLGFIENGEALLESESLDPGGLEVFTVCSDEEPENQKDELFDKCFKIVFNERSRKP